MTRPSTQIFRFKKSIIVIALMAGLVMSCTTPRKAQRFIGPSWTPTAPDPAWVERTLKALTLEEKAAQLVFVWTEGSYMAEGSAAWQTLERLTTGRKLGGFIFSIGDVYEYPVQINKLQALADVPLLIAADFEYGAGMRIRKATTFPRAMALGATRNPEFAYEMGRATAREARALGVHQNYAPVADVNNNPENPVINTRSFGDNPDLVASMALAFIKGSQDEGVIATVKHFPGHGDTHLDTHLALPILTFSRARFDSLELPPFQQAINEGVLSVMVAHISATAFDSVSGIPATVSPMISTGLLKEQMGFKGLVVTDAMVMEGVAAKYHPGESAVLAIQAGADLVLMPPDADVAVNALVSAVKRGSIPMQRLDESVRRVLTLKQWTGITENRFVDVDRVAEVVASPDHQRLATEIARKSITVLGNKGGLLPLMRTDGKKVVDLVLSDQDDPLSGRPFHAELVKRLGPLDEIVLVPRNDSLDFVAALDSLMKADVVIAQLHFYTRSGEMTGFAPAPVSRLLDSLEARGKHVIGVSFGNPYIVMGFPGIDSYVCAYSGAPVVVSAAAEVIFGEEPALGKLPVTMPGVFSFGSGVRYDKVVLRNGTPPEAGLDPERLARVDEIIQKAIADSAFPGAQLAVVRKGIVVLNKSYGAQTYELYSPLVTNTTLFDLASVTKVIATTSAVMKLVDEGRIALEDPVVKHLPAFGQNGKSHILIHDLMVHTSGLPAWKKFYEFCQTPECVVDSVFSSGLVYRTGDSTLYSDLGLIAMSKLLEKVTGKPLDQYVDSVFFRPLGMTSTMFNPPPALHATIAPTEIDTYWQRTGMAVRGRVHAATLGGVSGHAGLFSNATDLTKFLQMLLNGGTYGRQRFLNEETVRRFTKRQSSASTRAMGWDTRGSGRSFSGVHTSEGTFLHTGFTGTSVVCDPEKNLIVIFLTNRVYPTRQSSGIFDVRPEVHNAIFESLE
ncbi:MAG: glycoside hydrolase family 3 N-terminal domain-containing protein [Bacteroidota bacterium]